MLVIGSIDSVLKLDKGRELSHTRGGMGLCMQQDTEARACSHSA